MDLSEPTFAIGHDAFQERLNGEFTNAVFGLGSDKFAVNGKGAVLIGIRSEAKNSDGNSKDTSSSGDESSSSESSYEPLEELKWCRAMVYFGSWSFFILAMSFVFRSVV